MTGASVPVVQRAIRAAAEALIAAQDELCHLDAAAGDGDHGLAMAAAARGSLQRTEPPSDIGELLDGVSSEFASVGGSMGALTSVLISALAEEGRQTDIPLTAVGVARLLAAGENAIATLGGARRGDKTVLDALVPAREAADGVARGGGPAQTAVLAAAEAAEDGAEATAAMTARIGRASRLGDRSLGFIDPGARSFSIALRAVASTYAAPPTDGVERASNRRLAAPGESQEH